MTRTQAALLVGYCSLVFLGGVAALVVTMAGDSAATGLSPVSNAIFLCNPMVSVVVGALLALRRPDSWAGWTLLILATAFDGATFAKAVLSGAHAGWDWAGHLLGWGAWLDNWTWTVFYGGLLYTVLRFAGDGPRDRRLRAVGRFGFVPVVGLFVCCVLISDDVTDAGYTVHTPIQVGLSNALDQKIIFPLFLLVLVPFLCSVIALIRRRQTAIGVERAQLRWVIWSFATGLGLLVGGEALRGAFALLGLDSSIVLRVVDPVDQLAFFAIPISIFISVTRHGLFEIDRVISRTATYSLLVLVLTVAYAVIVTSITRLLPDRFGALGVAATTLAVAAAFLPLRRRLITIIDRRFNRSRVDAEHTVAAFAEQVRRDDATDPSGHDLLVAVQDVFQPLHASVWVAPR